MTEPSWLCGDPECKGCRYWRENRKAIEARTAAQQARKRVPAGRGNLDAARAVAGKGGSGRGY